LYSDENFGACPRTDFAVILNPNIFSDEQVPKPSRRNMYGEVSATMEQTNRMEAVLGSHGRSGDQFDVWQVLH
jgi:hypothetical protein